MRAINLTTAYQLALAALLLGACLGTLGNRFSQGGVPTNAQTADITQNSDLANADRVFADGHQDANVQVEVEVHARGNAAGSATVVGPGNSEVKTSANGPGDGVAGAYFVGNVLLPTPPPANSGSTSPAAPQASVGAAQVTVSASLINLRNGPTLNAAAVGNAGFGQIFTVIGRDATATWWQVCCVAGQIVWVAAEVVAFSGEALRVPVVAVSGQPPVQPPAPPTSMPMALQLPTSTPIPEYEFDLVQQEQFEERITPRVFLYVAAPDRALEGYTLRVKKDGAELPPSNQSSNAFSSFTWPLPNERQRPMNFKVEFPNINPTGIWEVMLIDASGRIVGPPATFQMAPNDPKQELYVSYRKR